jgi:hypothetical protein
MGPRREMNRNPTQPHRKPIYAVVISTEELNPAGRGNALTPGPAEKLAQAAVVTSDILKAAEVEILDPTLHA